jgi:hypothetical protein
VGELASVSRNAIFAAAQLGLIVQWAAEPRFDKWLPLQHPRAVSSEDTSRVGRSFTPAQTGGLGDLISQFLESEKRRIENSANGGGVCSDSFDGFSLCLPPAEASKLNEVMMALDEIDFLHDPYSTLPPQVMLKTKLGSLNIASLITSGLFDSMVVGEPAGNPFIFEGSNFSVGKALSSQNTAFLQLLTSHLTTEGYDCSSDSLRTDNHTPAARRARRLSHPLEFYLGRLEQAKLAIGEHTDPRCAEILSLTKLQQITLDTLRLAEEKRKGRGVEMRLGGGAGRANTRLDLFHIDVSHKLKSELETASVRVNEVAQSVYRTEAMLMSRRAIAPFELAREDKARKEGQPVTSTSKMLPAHLFRGGDNRGLLDPLLQFCVFVKSPRMRRDSWTWNGRIGHLESRVQEVIKSSECSLKLASLMEENFLIGVYVYSHVPKWELSTANLNSEDWLSEVFGFARQFLPKFRDAMDKLYTTQREEGILYGFQEQAIGRKALLLENFVSISMRALSSTISLGRPLLANILGELREMKQARSLQLYGTVRAVLTLEDLGKERAYGLNGGMITAGLQRLPASKILRAKGDPLAILHDVVAAGATYAPGDFDVSSSIVRGRLQSLFDSIRDAFYIAFSDIFDRMKHDLAEGARVDTYIPPARRHLSKKADPYKEARQVALLAKQTCESYTSGREAIKDLSFSTAGEREKLASVIVAAKNQLRRATLEGNETLEFKGVMIDDCENAWTLMRQLSSTMGRRVQAVEQTEAQRLMALQEELERMEAEGEDMDSLVGAAPAPVACQPKPAILEGVLSCLAGSAGTHCVSELEVAIVRSLIEEGDLAGSPEEIACIIGGDLIPSIGNEKSQRLHLKFLRAATSQGVAPSAVAASRQEGHSITYKITPKQVEALHKTNFAKYLRFASQNSLLRAVNVV